MDEHATAPTVVQKRKKDPDKQSDSMVKSVTQCVRTLHGVWAAHRHLLLDANSKAQSIRVQTKVCDLNLSSRLV
jgi:hypothetical protein